MIISNFKDKKVVDYLKTGEFKKVLIINKHGLGDSIMFYPLLQKLRELFPEIEISCLTHLGQEKIYGNVSSNEADYDIVFSLGMPLAEWDKTQLTKADKCAVEELGISPCIEAYELPLKAKNPFIACHFFSTSFPQISLNEVAAATVWKTVIKNEFIPIDTHMCHQYANKKESYSFVNRTMTDIKADVETLAGVIKNCSAFIGVVSGNFWVALSQLPPERIFLFTREFPATKLTKLPIWSTSAYTNFSGTLENFIKSLK